MKKILLILSFIAIALSIVGCGGSKSNNSVSGQYSVKIEWVDGSSVTPDAKYIQYSKVTPGQVKDPDGKDGKYVAATGYELGGTNWHRHVFLKAHLIDNSTGLEVNPTPEQMLLIKWSFSKPEEVVQASGMYAELLPNSPGKIIATASYNYQAPIPSPTASPSPTPSPAVNINASDSIEIAVFKKILMSDDEHFVSKLKLKGYVYNSADPDITVTRNGETFTIDAPGGIALVEKMPVAYLDPIPRYNLGLIKTVPNGLDFNTSVQISNDDSGIYIIKSKDGSGYAKVAFCSWFYEWVLSPIPSTCLDAYFDYTETGTFEAAF